MIVSLLIRLYMELHLWGGQTCWPQDLNEMQNQTLASWRLSYLDSLLHDVTYPSLGSPFPCLSHLPKSILSKSFPCPRGFRESVFKSPRVQLQNPSSHLLRDLSHNWTATVPQNMTPVQPHMHEHVPIHDGDPWRQDLPHHLTSLCL